MDETTSKEEEKKETLQKEEVEVKIQNFSGTVWLAIWNQVNTDRLSPTGGFIMRQEFAACFRLEDLSRITRQVDKRDYRPDAVYILLSLKDGTHIKVSESILPKILEFVSMINPVLKINP